MPAITVQIHTASRDNFLTSQGIPSAIEMVVDSLQRQSFKDFELVYIDRFYEQNKDKIGAIQAPFCIKHVPVHPAHRHWVDRGHVAISAAKNTGILYADGELIVTCDDGEVFPEFLLSRYWRAYTSGHYLHAAHRRMKSIVTNAGKVVYPIQGDIYINDSRPVSQEVTHHSTGSWLYAGTSFSLADALTLNGFNEKCDGAKMAEDCEFGGRLQLLGRNFVFDKSAYLYIIDHPHYGNTDALTDFVAVEAYGFYTYNFATLNIRANVPVNDIAMQHLIDATKRYRGFDPTLPENAEKLAVWKSTPNFNLMEQRAELRADPTWRWPK